MKSIIFLFTLISFNALADEFTYDNTWYVIYQNENTNLWPTKDEHLVKIPEQDCVLGPVVHKYDAQTKDDAFSRVVACFKPELQETFKCSFDPNWKDEDGEADPTATACSKKYKDFELVFKIRRYQDGKYLNKDQQKKAVESTQAI